MNKCTHWERTECFELVYDDYTGESEHQWVTREECLQVDIDIHRFKCTACGEIGYYSGAARRFYEEGERSPGIKGLE